MGLLVVAVAIAMVMVISLLLVRRKPYGTISHGIVEVRKTNAVIHHFLLLPAGEISLSECTNQLTNSLSQWGTH